MVLICSLHIICNTGWKGYCTDIQDTEATLAASSNLSLCGAGELIVGVHEPPTGIL